MPKVSREVRVGVSFESAARLLADQPADVLGGGISVFVSEVFGLEVGHRVRVVPGDLVVVERPIHVAALPFTIEASPESAWFPVFEGEIEVTATSDCGIHLALEGEYHPPGGLVGAIADRVLLHRLAEDAIDHFFESVRVTLGDEASSFDALTGVPV